MHWGLSSPEESRPVAEGSKGQRRVAAVQHRAACVPSTGALPLWFKAAAGATELSPKIPLYSFLYQFL
jgi:hypothetical protein